MTKLPYNFNFDDIALLKALNKANHTLGRLNGPINLLPNPYIIFNAITLGEAKESSEIENIVTTFDEIFKEMTYSKTNPASEEVLNYRQAMLTGFELITENGFLSANHIIRIHHIVEPEAGDIRKLPGTVIKNTKTGAVLHTPPQNYEEISDYLANLEKYINTKEFEDIDAILKIAVIHFQFESIHPFDTYLFYDFYTKNEYLCEKLKISRNTSSKYLHQLSEAGILIEEKIGKTKLYKNVFSYNLRNCGKDFIKGLTILIILNKVYMQIKDGVRL